VTRRARSTCGATTIDVDSSSVAGVMVRCFEASPDTHSKLEATMNAAGGTESAHEPCRSGSFELAAPLGGGRVGDRSYLACESSHPRNAGLIRRTVRAR